MKYKLESDEICCLHIGQFNNRNAIHFWASLTPICVFFFPLSLSLVGFTMSRALSKGGLMHLRKVSTHVSLHCNDCTC